MKTLNVHVGELARDDRGAFKIGPFGSSLKKSELVSSGIPVAGIENVLPNEFVKGFRRFVASRKFNELSDYEIRPGDVLVTTMGTIGRAAVAPSDIGRAIIDSHLFRMRVETNRVYPQFLCYALNSELVISQLKRMARGAIMEGLNTSILKECVIPLPELPEQKRIAALLKKTDWMRRTRRYARRLGDTFLQSVFLEMFGELRLNPMGWDRLLIDDVLIWSQYGTSQKSNAERRGYPVLGMGNITTQGRIDLSSLGFVDLTADEFKKLKLESGDIIFNRTNSTELVGKTACWRLDIDAVIASYLVKLRLNLNVVPEFFAALLNSAYFKKLFQDRCKKAVGQSNISPTLLREFSIYVPPLPLQEKFADIVRRFERLRAQQREAERQAEHLFQTLLHRAFGELVSVLPERLDHSRKIFSAEDYFGQLIPALVSAVRELPLEKLNATVALLFIPRVLKPMIESSGDAAARQHFERFNQPLTEAAFRSMLTLLVKNRVIRFDPKDPKITLQIDNETHPPVDPIVADDARYLAAITLTFPEAAAEKARNLLPAVARKELVRNLPS